MLLRIKIKNLIKLILPFTGITLGNIKVVIQDEYKLFVKQTNKKQDKYLNKDQ